MYKIAVMGDRASIYGFASLGLEIYPVSSPDEGSQLLRKLGAGDFAVIYITEALASKLESDIEKFREKRIPAIILIPGVSGNTGAGARSVHKSVEKAVGSDIL